MNERILNQLVRLMRFLSHHTQGEGPPPDLEQLEILKAKIRDNPRLDLGAAGEMLQVPVLLMVSKADALAALAPGADPLRYAQGRLRLTHRRALQNIRVARWAAAAPFVGQSQVAEESGYVGGGASAREKLDFRRKSYGVGQALDWLDAELSGRWVDGHMTARRAQSRVARWNPFTPKGPR
jgi:hypothetical protein